MLASSRCQHSSGVHHSRHPHDSGAHTKTRLLTLIAFGFHGLEPPIASHSSLSEGIRRNSLAKTDPRIEQEGDT
jgi:hypothetical protein